MRRAAQSHFKRTQMQEGVENVATVTTCHPQSGIAQCSTTTKALSSLECLPPLLLTRTPATSLASGIYQLHRALLQSSILVLLLINFLFECV